MQCEFKLQLTSFEGLHVVITITLWIFETHIVILSEMQIGIQKRCLIKMYNTEDFIMKPEGPKWDFKKIEVLRQV